MLDDPSGDLPSHDRELAKAGHPAPRGIRPFVRRPWGRIGLWLMLLVGAVVQLVVVALVYQLVDLSISLMELWTELARKHLEIILT